MTSKGTDRHSIRVEADLWEAFGNAAANREGGRSGVLREFIRRFIKNSAAALPERTDEADKTDD